jgi:hypothetical protein
MRRCLTFGAALLVAAAAPAGGQTNLSADSLRKILREAAHIEFQLDASAPAYAMLQARAQALIAAFGRHNAEPCEALQGQEEMCAGYDLDRQDLMARSRVLQKELTEADAPRHALRIRFDSMMTTLRTALYAPAIASQKERYAACAGLNGVVQEAKCLTRVERATAH